MPRPLARLDDVMTARALLLVVGAWLAPSIASAIDCSGTSTGHVPLTDLGAGLYQGFAGGLYPGGANHRPASHDSAGVAIANAIVPLDTLGQPDPVNGRVVLVSIGMSNCTQEFSAFVPKAMSDPQRNPRLLVIDCAQGGQTASIVKDPSANFWTVVAQRLRARGSAPAQVQAVWIKEANAQPTTGFPAAANTLRDDLGGVVRTIHAKLPNVRLGYLTSRIYAGYATTTLNPEPYAYESGFSVKWLVEAQIAGEDSLNFDAASGPVEAPWMAWGPYLWADGLSPRADGFTWPCADFEADGTHPGPIAEGVVSDSLLAFFKADDTTRPWFVNTTTDAVAAPPARLALTVAPNPSHGMVAFAFVPGAAWSLSIVDAAGRRVADVARGAATPARVTWDGRDAFGRRVPPGVYWAKLTSEGRTVSARLVR